MTITFLPSGTAARAIEALDPDAALTGPDREIGAVDIDPVFAKPFSDLQVDILESVEVERIEDAFHATRTLMSGDRFEIVEMRARDGDTLGLIALARADGAPLGAILGPTLAVDPQAQGMGVGRSLVAVELLTRGRLAVWDLDEVAYSPAGAACIRSGLRLARDILEAGQSPSPDP